MILSTPPHPGFAPRSDTKISESPDDGNDRVVSGAAEALERMDQLGGDSPQGVAVFDALPARRTHDRDLALDWLAKDTGR